MSKITNAIMKINDDLNRISGMDGLVGDYVVLLEEDIHNRVEWILKMLELDQKGSK